LPYCFRLAASRDRDAVFAFCAQTWPNGDYIPLVWDEWLGDREGAFVAGIDEADAPIAVAKLSVAAPGEGWLEGVRVAPERRERGLGRALLNYLADYAWAHGLRTLRFITEAANAPMHHVAAACGFAVVGAHQPFRTEATGPAGARLARPEEAPTLWEAARAALAPAELIRWQAWTGAAATPGWLAVECAAGHALVAADRSFVVLAPPHTWRSAPHGRPPVVEVAFLAATAAACPELLAAAQGWAAAHGSEQVFGLLPPVAVPAAHAAGWASRTERPMDLFRRDRPAGQSLE
jgi:GNAT superfamily N-acetyltransferase